MGRFSLYCRVTMFISYIQLVRCCSRNKLLVYYTIRKVTIRPDSPDFKHLSGFYKDNRLTWLY
jgi:hypothetical protein